MTESVGFARLPPKPKNWEEVFAITGGLDDIPISLIERGRLDHNYQFDSKDLRPCGRQGCKQKHANGWIVAIEGQRFVHIGNDCAQKYANPDIWDQRLGEYKARVEKDARDQALVQARDEAQRKLHWLDSDDVLDEMISLFESFSVEAKGPLLDEIEQRAEKNRTKIEIEVRLSQEQRDLQRVMALGAQFDVEGNGPYASASDLVTVAELAGLTCFKNGKSPRYLKLQLLRHADVLLKWFPPAGDRDGVRALMRSTRELGPAGNGLNESKVAAQKFFSQDNLQALMKLEVIRKQGITSIERVGNRIRIVRLPHWQRAA